MLTYQEDYNMWKDILYVSVDSLNFWWGVYNLTNKMTWEDITIYNKVGRKYNKIARTCICSRKYLQYSQKKLKDDPDEKDYLKEIEDFLNNNDIKYHYCYDAPNSEDFYEVSFEAQRNEIGVKPCYIEVWHPDEEIDKNMVDECVKRFVKKFLNMDLGKVEFKDTVSFKKALKEYIEEMERWNRVKEISFSNELIESLEKEWNIPKEKVIETLNKSIK